MLLQRTLDQGAIPYAQWRTTGTSDHQCTERGKRADRLDRAIGVYDIDRGKPRDIRVVVDPEAPFVCVDKPFGRDASRQQTSKTERPQRVRHVPETVIDPSSFSEASSRSGDKDQPISVPPTNRRQ